MNHSKKKLVFIVNNWPPKVDGVGDYTWNLSHEFARKGFNVSVICFKQPGVEYENSPLVKVLPVVTEWSHKGTRQLVEKIKELHSDCILFQYVPYSFNKKGIPLQLPSLFREWKQYTGNLLVFFHEPYIRLRFIPVHIFLVGVLQRLIASRLCAIADRVITSIDLYKTFLQAYSNKNIDLIPIGSNILSATTDDAIINELRMKVAPSGEKIISTFGVRNHQLLIDVFKLILQKNSHCRLLICGAVQNTEIYKEVTGHVYITGYLSSSEIFNYLKASDVFFLPDEITKKGLGGTSNKSTSLAAALAADLPVIGIKGDMNNALLNEAKHVYLEEGDKHEAIAQRIVSVFNSPDQGKGNVIFWKENLSWEKIAGKYNL